MENSFNHRSGECIINRLLKRRIGISGINNFDTNLPTPSIAVSVIVLVIKVRAKYLPLLINPDQTGSIINRLSSSNLRRLINIIHFANKNKIPLAVFLNIEKAFEVVEWPYLSCFGLTCFLMNLISALC